MRENSNFDFKMESISNIDDLISWWKGANHEDQSTITTLCSFPDYLKRLFKESSCGGKMLCNSISFINNFTLPILRTSSFSLGRSNFQCYRCLYISSTCNVLSLYSFNSIISY